MDVDHFSSNEDTNSVDGEGVWTQAVEIAFQEADRLYPPCGRRKHIIQGEGGGRMLGRNELIAKYILDKTGKVRTRKQVSSHIQVLARRRAKVEASVSSSGTPSPPDSHHNGAGSGATSGAASVAYSMQHQLGPLQTQQQQPLTQQQQFNYQHNGTHVSSFIDDNNQLHNQHNLNQQQQHHMIGYMNGDWFDCPISTHKVRLVEFSAFVELKSWHSSTSSLHSSTSNLAGLTRTLTISDDQPLANPMINNGYCTPTFSPTTNTRFQYPSYQQSPTMTNSNQMPLTVTNEYLNNNIPPGQELDADQSAHYHPYIKIDYKNKQASVANRLEHIHFNEVKDKFANPGFHRCPADALFLVKFWADINENISSNELNSIICFSNLFETCEPYKYLNCSTRACSYGHQVVEKVEKVFGSYDNLTGRYSYQIDKSPMCDFMVQCIRKLRQLSEVSHMNNVLENLTALQVIESDKSEILLCLAYVFEIPENRDCRPLHHVYRLIRD